MEMSENLSDLDIGGFNLLEDALEAPAPLTAKTQEPPKLGELAQMILSNDAICVHSNPATAEKMKLESRERLALLLGVSTQDIQDIVDMYGAWWTHFLVQERMKLMPVMTQRRDVSWDRLEMTVLGKMQALVETRQSLTLAELLAVGRVANQANRGDKRGSGHPQQPVHTHQTNIQSNLYLGGNPAQGILPAGDLGKINLSLQPRLVKQIESQAIRTGLDRSMDGLEMLTIKEIQAAGKEDEPDGNG